MRTAPALSARLGGLAIVLLISSAFARNAAPLPAHAAVAAVVAEVTTPDLAASNAKVQMAYNSLVAMWSADFARRGARFAPPALLRYRGAVRTPCGVMSPDNAVYCMSRNSIYFDELFLARLAGAAGQALGTDGDMAAVGVIAHEMGHAVTSQLGADSRIPYENEAAADCLAGVFTAQSARDGSLEPGDLEEAFFGLAAAGDPTPQLTGNRRIDDRILTHAALMGHGTRAQRLANFNAGYKGGQGACLAELRG